MKDPTNRNKSVYSPHEMVKKKRFIEQISNCIENRKIVKLHLKWETGKKETKFFKPYLLGDDPNDSGLFVYGWDMERGYADSFHRLNITRIEITDYNFPIKNRIKAFFYWEEKILKSLPELKIQSTFSKNVSIEMWDDDDKLVTPEATKTPCTICGSDDRCEHIKFLTKLFNKQQADIEANRKHSVLLQNAIDDHQNIRIIIELYNIKDSLVTNMQSRVWDESCITILCEWSYSPMHQGNLHFLIKTTSDKKYWALFENNKIHAVAEIVNDSNIIVENIAAKLMSVYAINTNSDIELFDILSKENINERLLLGLYDYYYEESQEEQEEDDDGNN